MKLYTFNIHTLQFEKVSLLVRILKFLGIIFLGFIFLGVNTSKTYTQYITDTENVLLISDNSKFSEEKLVHKIKELNLPFPHITLAQAKLESGDFSSKIFKENNNLFGMKEARVRINLARGTQFGHAYYNSWEESILDYCFWYSNYARRCKNEKELFQLLGKIYAEDTRYVELLQNIISTQNLKSKLEI
jgi:flagellum-specific peptidoglycan hydrolase FlgJ